MEFEVIAVKDEMTGEFLQPTFIKTQEEAIRIFDYQVNNIELWKYNPGDYSLYKLGTYNAKTGEITSEVSKIIGGNAVAKGKKGE